MVSFCNGDERSDGVCGGGQNGTEDKFIFPYPVVPLEVGDGVIGEGGAMFATGDISHEIITDE